MTIAFAKDRRVMLIDVVKRPRMILNSGAFGRDFGLLTSFIFFSKKKKYILHSIWHKVKSQRQVGNRRIVVTFDTGPRVEWLFLVFVCVNFINHN